MHPLCPWAGPILIVWAARTGLVLALLLFLVLLPLIVSKDEKVWLCLSSLQWICGKGKDRGCPS